MRNNGNLNIINMERQKGHKINFQTIIQDGVKLIIDILNSGINEFK